MGTQRNAIVFDSLRHRNIYITFILRQVGYNAISCFELATIKEPLESFRFDIIVIDNAFPGTEEVYKLITRTQGKSGARMVIIEKARVFITVLGINFYRQLSMSREVLEDVLRADSPAWEQYGEIAGTLCPHNG